MGQDIEHVDGSQQVRDFTKRLLTDVQALDHMLKNDMMEKGVRRFGCEQEMFLVDRSFRPAPVAVEVLERLKGQDAFTTELARFNLEMNLEPRVLEGDCFTWLEGRINELLQVVRAAAHEEGARVILSGILPTLSKSDLSLDNITPKARYFALNDALNKMRSGSYRLKIEGRDELNLEHDSVMLEACNTSCQLHLQVESDEFARAYNIAQAVTGPVMAAAVNSPLLFGKRLWAETRIALFQQSLDTRSSVVDMRDLAPRVRFGDAWVEESAIELFQRDIAQFRVLLAEDVDEDPFEILRGGGVPKLQALQLYNSTVYRWNRPCYGISDGKPHLRIECRALPAGPSVLDEVANAVFWIGTVMGVSKHYRDVAEHLDFDDVKSNFLAASRHGLNAGFYWMDRKEWSSKDLLTQEFLPLAREGLKDRIDSEDIDRYLGVIEKRIASGHTGSTWALKSLMGMKDKGMRGERLTALAAATLARQNEGTPVHEWELARIEDGGGWNPNFLRVEQFMTTHLFTVHEDELLEMVTFLMHRKQIRHVPVEDDQHGLVGLVSYRSILKMVSQMDGVDRMANPVSEIMERNPLTVSPETSTQEAIELMRTHRVSCLPVCKDERLVGLVSETDFMPIAYQLLQDKMNEE
jgi:CBS domain-containing protein